MSQYIRWGYGKYEARNTRILEAVLKGRTYRDVAQETGLSSERIRQIVARYCRKAAKIFLARMPPGERITIRWLRQYEDEFIKYLPKCRSTAAFGMNDEEEAPQKEACS